MTLKIKSKTLGWKAAIDAAHTMNDEGAVEISPEGLIFKIKDASGHAAQFFHWPKEHVISLEITEPVKIGFRVDDFRQILNRFSSDSEIDVIMEDGVNALTLKSNTKQFQMQLIAFQDFKVPPSINIELPIKFDMELAEMGEVLSDTKFLGHGLIFSCKDNHIQFECKGEYHNAKIVYREFNAPDNSSRFNLEYLVPLFTVMKSHADKIRIGFGNNTPLHVQFDIPEIGNINYFLAPMI